MGRKSLQKSSNKLINTQIKSSDNKLIYQLSKRLKENEKDELITEQIFHNPETLTIIKMILTKYEKDETDIFVLSKYLKSLKGFMLSITQNQPEDFDPNPLLKIMSYNLECEEYLKNNFIMRVGEIGKKFYVILSGNVSVLVPKVLSVFMNKKQYISHLKMLFKYNEINLLERTFYNNSSVYDDIRLEEIKEEKKKKKKKKKKLLNEEDKNILSEEEQNEKNKFIIPLILSNNNKSNNKKEEEKEEEEFTVEKYISEINAEDLYKEKDSKEVKIVGYYKVTNLSQGSSFGEYALINDDQQRTASIFVNENSVFGTLSSNAYKESIKAIQEEIKKKNVEFVFSSQLFNQISIFLFSQNYWNYFIRKKIVFGEYLFKQGEERNKIYFLQEGEFKITANHLNHKKVNLIISQLGNINFEKVEYADIGKCIDLPISFAKKGDILGMEDLLYNNQFFCSAICITKKASFFSIDFSIFQNICKYYKKVLENWKRMENDKKVLMIQKLQGLKFTNKNSLSGEFRKENENAVFWKSNIDEDEQLKKYYTKEKKYSKLRTFNTFFNKFDKTLLNNRNTIIEKKIDPYTLNKLRLERKNLPPVKTINEFNSPSILRNTQKIMLTNNDIIAENVIESYGKISITNHSSNKSIFNNNVLNNHIFNINKLKKNLSNFKDKKKSLSILDLEKSIKKNKEDIISKMILGKSIEGSLDGQFYLPKPEGEKTDDNIIYNKINQNKVKKVYNLKSNSSVKRSNIMKKLNGLEKYNRNKINIINSLNLDFDLHSD